VDGGTGATEPTLYEWLGGIERLERMTRLFYDTYVPEDPLLAPVFAGIGPDHPERVAAWLGEVFGGPKTYTEEYGGYDWMVSQHLGRALTEEQRARWVQLMCRCADEAGLPTDPEFRAAFVAYLEWGSRLAVENSTPGATPPKHLPVPRWWWVCDATPGSRVSALAPAEDDERAAADPVTDGPPRFQEHIAPLFRDRDRASMKFVFDLWSYADVSERADAILDRLRDGSMPCDGAWPADQVAVFERWIEAGKLA
jgi:truncated hemoglobin YjbI